MSAEWQAVVLLVDALCYRNVAGSSPDEIAFFNLPNPCGRSMPWGRLSL
jgi:hypothetical protein